MSQDVDDGPWAVGDGLHVQAFDAVPLPHRPGKPRLRGLTYVRDMGLSVGELEQRLIANGDAVDIVKLAGVSPRLQTREAVASKIEMCRRYDVEVGLGGPLLELALLDGPRTVESFLGQAADLGIATIEVCRHFISLPDREYFATVAAVRERGIRPLPEIGVAYGINEEVEVSVHVDRLITTMQRSLDAGAWKVLLESEGITESRHRSQYRLDIPLSVASAIDLDQLMFEADDPEVWNWYIGEFGHDVNLFVDVSRVSELEASRLGGWAQPLDVVRRIAVFDPR